MTTAARYWFAAAPFGHGWWRPSHPLGWVSVAAAIGLAFLASRMFPPGASPLAFWLSIVVIAFAFLLVCKLKGEPLGQRQSS